MHSYKSLLVMCVLAVRLLLLLLLLLPLLFRDVVVRHLLGLKMENVALDSLVIIYSCLHFAVLFSACC